MKILSSTNVRAVERLLEPCGRQRSQDNRGRREDRRRPSGARGDAALIEYARRFDRLDGDLEVSQDEIEELAVRVPPKVRAAIAAAARKIEKVARRQRPQGWTSDDGSPE